MLAKQRHKAMLKAYYARPISIDGTKQADRDFDLIRKLGFEPYPIGKAKEAVLAKYKEIGMKAFKPYVERSNALVFRAFPDGSIGNGVAVEIEWALAAGIPVIETPRQIGRRRLSVEDTRAMLSELGQR